MRRTIGILAAAVLAATVMSVCKRETDKKVEVGKAITKTEQLSRQFVYADAAGGHTTQVVGLFEDDFRYKSRLSIDGKPIDDEVTDDDSLAERFISTDELPKYLNPSVLAAAAGGVNPAASPVLSALATRHWVLDKTGAPKTTAVATDTRKPGEDPVYDALTILEYVRGAVNESIQVKKYSPDDIEPVYKSTEDPFPKPAHGARTVRYDLRPPALPKFDAAQPYRRAAGSGAG